MRAAENSARASQPSTLDHHEKNWIKTAPTKGFFVVFRFYCPTEGYIEKT